MLNCRVNTNEVNIFANIFNNMYFWLIVIVEFAVQIAFIWFSGNDMVKKLFSTDTQSLGMIITAYVLGASVLPFRAAITQIDADKFKGMLSLDLEKNTNTNCVTKLYYFITRDELPLSAV